MGDCLMRLTSKKLKGLILEVLSEEREVNHLEEAKMDELTELCFLGRDGPPTKAKQSTHTLATCKLRGDKYYLKFTENFHWMSKTDRSMQLAVEFLAYKIYQLYPSNAPENIEIVSDPSQKRIGLATREVKGVPGRSVDFKQWVDSISGGAMVDIFLANWDVKNTNNFVVDTETNIASRVDPGGALTFRAQGGRKGDNFSPRAGELNTMTDPSDRRTSGFLLSEVDTKKAASAFLSVEWNQIYNTIGEAYSEVEKELINADLSDQVGAWKQEVSEIVEKLRTRHADVKEHCEYVMTQP